MGKDVGVCRQPSDTSHNWCTPHPSPRCFTCDSNKWSSAGPAELIIEMVRECSPAEQCASNATWAKRAAAAGLSLHGHCMTQLMKAAYKETSSLMQLPHILHPEEHRCATQWDVSVVWSFSPSGNRGKHAARCFWSLSFPQRTFGVTLCVIRTTTRLLLWKTLQTL